MPTIGYCHDCAEWLRLGDDLACPNGHAPARVNGWYDELSGRQVSPPSASIETVATPAAVPSVALIPSAAPSRNAFLSDLMSTLAGNSAFTAAWGDDTDMTIVSNPVDGSWGAGKKRVEYQAAVRAVEADATVYFWEMLKERTSGFSFGTFESESYTQVGTHVSGSKHEATMGPGSVSWEWGYGTLRTLVEEVAARHGFVVRVTLARSAACW